MFIAQLSATRVSIVVSIPVPIYSRAIRPNDRAEAFRHDRCELLARGKQHVIQRLVETVMNALQHSRIVLLAGIIPGV